MMSFWFLYDNPEKSEKDNLDKEIKFLLDSKRFSWEKIYLFSAFVTNDGVGQVKKILEHRSLHENTEVVIAIGTKTCFNKPSDIQEILSLSKSQKIKTEFVSFICPKTINDESYINENFHIKAYCFLGSMKGKGSKIGFSIIGSSNLTKAGLEGKGELCISIQNLNLTKELIDRLSNKYISKSPPWDEEKIKEYERQYNEKHSRKDQNEVLPQSQENSTPVNQDQQPIPNRPDGKFIKLGVLTDSVLRAKATNLTNDSKNIHCFHSSHKTIEQAKVDFLKGSLCLLLTENKEYQIVEIMPYLSDQENTEGCFVRYKKNVTYELSEDIGEILEKKEEYEKIKIAEEKYKEYRERNQYPKLEYATLKDFEEKVKEYQEMLQDDKYKKGLEKAKKMKSQIDILLNEIEEIDPIILKKKLKEISDSI
ncbi:phospholipase D family protein [Microcoleus asticus]|uniref:Phospholipase D-like domain-containing protein n=1 Tax=Microcoleus asticus IPMA8 TaxID=2563858 RepID=A0ABX2CPW6_9CYAN|nr:phospholipase D family protein [Microcoleus asticus]NQE32454.1 hypothetical protein [Microcoleus asticus IPMA8]